MAKRAFLVGINKFSQNGIGLRGCVNDIVSLKNLLIHRFGFPEQETITLYDAKATRANIIEGLASFLGGIQRGDVAVIAFSTHGTQKGRNVSGEEDGKNEAIVPHDVGYNTLIVDDELYGMITPVLESVGPEHVNFTAIFDLCHAGTIVRDVIFDHYSVPYAPVLNRCVPTFFFEEVDIIRDAQPGPYNAFTACLDDETAADLFGSEETYGVPRGAFSFALHEIIRADASVTIKQLEEQVTPLLKKVSPRHKQTPQYYFGIDPDAKIFAEP